MVVVVVCVGRGGRREEEGGGWWCVGHFVGRVLITALRRIWKASLMSRVSEVYIAQHSWE